MDFRVLGPLEVTTSNGLARIGPLRQRVVLATLLLERDRVVPTYRLATAVWGDNLPATARAQIQICISSLRRILAEGTATSSIVTVPPGYLIRVPEGRIDIDRFERAVEQARNEAAAGHLDPAVRCLRSALSLWRGPAYADVTSDLVQSAALRLHEMYIGATEECVDLEIALGRHHEVIQELTSLVAEHPLRERLRKQQIIALYRCGRKADALAAYRAARLASIDELGLEPSVELRRIERAVLTDTVELATPAPSPTRASPFVPRQLPAALPDFVGRTTIVSELDRLLRRSELTTPTASVVILTGPAGIGKTALAAYVSHRASDAFPDGQLFIDLHGSDTRPLPASRALERAVRALGTVGSAIAEGLDERLELYRSLLAERRALIILDDAGSSEQVTPLCPGLGSSVVLVTSRARLASVPGARLLEVGVLDTPDAVELLARTAGRHRVSADPAATEALAAICGGLPLALRIAGSRLAARPHWAVADLLNRLVDERRVLDELVHGELAVRLSMSVTYEALPEGARRLFRRLGVLNLGHFPAWVAAPLIDTDPQGSSDVLDQLVDARLVEVSVTAKGTPVGAHLHDLLRVYAREQLAAEETGSERTAALERLLGCLLYLVERAHEREYGGDYTVLRGVSTRWPISVDAVPGLLTAPLAWLDQERPLLVAAVRLATRAGFHDLAWELALSLVTLFELGAYFDDWRETHETALEAVQNAQNRYGEAAMRYSLGALAVAEQQPREAADHLEEALRLFTLLAHAHGRGLCLRHLAFLDRLGGRLDKAARQYADALECLRTVGDHVAEAHVLSGLAQIAVETSDLDRAQRLLGDALAICRRAGSRRVAAQVMHHLGEVHLQRDDHQAARVQFDAALNQVLEARDLIGEAYLRHGLSVCALRRGDLMEAETQVAAGLEAAIRTGERMVQARLLLARAQGQLTAGRPTSAAASCADALARFQALGAVVWQARAMDLLGGLHELSGDIVGAVEAWKTAIALLTSVDPRSAAPLAEKLDKQLREAGIDAA